MSKWAIVFLFLLILPFAAYAQDDTQDTAMREWAQQKFGIQIPNPEISQSWKSLPMVSDCDYEWHMRWNDARIQVKDGNDNYYRLSFQGNTLTLDFKRDFNWLFWG